MDELNMQEFRGRLPCKHSSFCYNCIFDWASISNSCPLCKAKFNQLERLRYCGNVLLENLECIYVEDRDQKPPELDPPYVDVRCVVCGTDTDEEIMLLCDACDSGFHTTCIGLRDIPQLQNWYCDDCLEEMPYAIQREQILTIYNMDISSSDVIKRHRKRLRRVADLETDI